MPIRPQTKQRVLIILTVLAVLVGAGGVVYFTAARREAAQLGRLREGGMAAYRAGEYGRAVRLLGQYIDKARAQHTDPEALFAYGRSRMVHEPTLRHLLESIKVFQTYEHLRPDDPAPRHVLLTLYPQVGYNEEALRLSDELLAADPADRAALRTKATILHHQAQKGAKSYEDALKVSEELNRVAPDDLAGQFLTQRILSDLKTDPQEILKRYEALSQSHPGDARYEMLLAEAQRLAGRQEQSLATLRDAARHAAGEIDLVPGLVMALDRLRLYGDSLALLESASVTSPTTRPTEPPPGGIDPRAWVRRALAQRQWQLGRYQAVADSLAGIDAKSPAADAHLLAYRALSLDALGRKAEAAPIVEALARREDDPTAAAWAKAIRAREADPPLPPAERVKAYQAALDDDADVAAIHYLLGEAYGAEGETELAVAAWRKAAELSPSWALPAAMAARAYNAAGRHAEALDAGAEAAERLPNAANQAAKLNAWFGLLGTAGHDKPDEAGKLLEAVRSFRAQVSDDVETLHLEPALLARTGHRDEAVARVHAILDAPPAKPLPLPTYLSLAAVSHSEKLGLEDDILAAAERALGPNPEIALRRAVLAHDAGRTPDGVALLQAGRQKATGADAQRAWGLALARFLDETRSPDAPAEWARLGDQYPDDLDVQSAALRSRTHLLDRDFWRHTLDRVKALTGEQGLTYRLERARWLLAAPDVSEKEASEAVDLLSRIVQASPTLYNTHWLLAGGYERLASFKQGKDRENFQNLAVEELKKAFDLRPDDVELARNLTHTLRATGHADETRAVLDRFAEASAQSPAQRTAAAAMLAGEGQLDAAVRLLEPVTDDPSVRRDDLLARLYRRTGRTKEAEAAYAALLGEDRPSVTALANGADFFAGQGRSDEAQKYLAKLATLKLRPGELEGLQARYAEQHGTAEEALRLYTAAANAPGAGAERWRALADFQLRYRRFADAVAAAEQGLKLAPNDRPLQSLRTRAQALEAYRNDPNLDSLAQALDDDPQSAATAEMLKVLSAARAAHEPAAQTVEKLRALVDRYPAALALQGHVVRTYLSLGRWREGVEVAQKAAAANPNHPDPARWLFAGYWAGRDWDQALRAARQWRQRTLDAPLDADLAVAQTLLRMRPPRAQEALDQLQPHVAPGADNLAVARTRAHALIVLRREGEAAKLLRPRAESQPPWRLAWLDLAATAFTDADAAGHWIDDVAPMIAQDATGERLALAGAWYLVGTDLGSAPALDKARQTLEPLVARPDAPAGAWRQWAVVAAAQGNLDEAERGYRKLLAAQPPPPQQQQAEVQNNLAYVLLTRGRREDLAEARTLAERAVAAEPGAATFYDTLARVQLAAGDRDAAARTFRQAVERDGRNVEALIGLADVLTQTEKSDEARQVLGQAETVLNDLARGRPAPPLPPAVQKQLDAVRAAVRQSAKAPIEPGAVE